MRKKITVATTLSIIFLSGHAQAIENPFASNGEFFIEPASHVEHFIPKQEYEAKLSKLVTEVFKGQAVLAGFFAGPSGLTGVLMQGKNEQSPTVVGWVPPGTNYVMVGKLFDRQGQDVTETAKKTFLSPSATPRIEGEEIQAVDEGQEMVRISDSHQGIALFNIKEPVATVYVFASHGCHYCRDMFESAKDLEDVFVEANVQMRWLMVGFDEDSIRKSAGIVSEGLKGAWDSPSNTATSKAIEDVYENSNLLIDRTSGDNLVVPTVVWTEDGEEKILGASMDEEGLRTLILRIAE